MVELHYQQLTFSFPEVHPDAWASVEFQRTLRIPDDDQEYPLPAGLGKFPLNHVDDFENVPQDWKTRGGIFMPMWQSEATWIRFSGSHPMAFKIAAGKINAVTGEPWRDALMEEPQDYVTRPEQPWLDGFCVDAGLVRQFVAMPLGDGLTVEEQLTGKAEFGGLQIIAYPLRADLYEEIAREREEREEQERRTREAMGITEEHTIRYSRGGADMGMAAGGLMRQEIYEDERGIDAWDQSVASRCYVHLVNAGQYQAITGDQPPQAPPGPDEYAEAGIPWYDYYRRDGKALTGSGILAKLDSLASMLRKKRKPLPYNQPVAISQTVQLGDERQTVRNNW